MIRKSSFWKALGGKSQKARHGWRKRSYAQPVMSVERLEDRYMLSGNPVVSVQANQFLPMNSNLVPFRALVSDVAEMDPQTFSYSINWGDSTPLDNGTPTVRQIQQPLQSLAPGDPIVGGIEAYHFYAAPGSYTVMLTVDDGLNGPTMVSTQVNVYARDPNFVLGDGINQDDPIEVDEGTPITLNLSSAGSTNTNITSWTINWGDTIETISGNPSSVTHTYADDYDHYILDTPDRYNVIASATGDNGTLLASVEPVRVLDVPEVVSATGPTDVNEGADYTINLSNIDPGDDPVAFWLIGWDYDPGTGNAADVSILPGDATTATHVYGNGDKTYHTFVAAANDDEAFGFQVIDVNVHNIPPVANAGGPYAVAEGGGLVTLDGSGSSDASGDISSLLYEWDLNNDGVYDDATGVNAIFDTTGIDGTATYPISLRVTDQDGAFDVSPTTLTVSNVAPTADFSGGGTVNEGGSASVAFASSFDPSAADTSAGFHYAYDFNNDGFFDVGDGTYGGSVTSASQAVPASFLADGNATYTVKGRIIDKDGGYTNYTAQIVVLNVAPTLAISGAASVNEGSSYTLNLSKFDPGADTIDHWTINWGDSTQVVSGNPSSVSHTYADGDANYTISASATDEDGIFAAGNTVAVTVHNVAPTVDNATLTVPESSPNGTVVGTVTAHDPGADTLSFSIVGGTGAAAFGINSATGQITVTNGVLLDFDVTPTLTLNVEVSDGEGGVGVGTVTINLIKLPSISGVVYVDVNHNGSFDANEPGIDGIKIKLLDQNGNPVLDSGGHAITTVTGNDGLYVFNGLLPGIYQVFEEQPTGVTDGAEHLGSLGGTIVANDRMQLTLGSTDAYDYVFAEFGQQLRSGDTAGIGFWQNKNGQALISQGGTQIAIWLTSHFGNIFGNTLVGMSGSQVATFYRDQVFKGLKLAGPAKVDAQFMAVALAAFFTDRTLAGQVAAAYGFNVTDTGIGTSIVNVGSKGAAFNVANGSDRTIMQLLLATNSLTDQSHTILGFAAIYDKDGNGTISSAEASLRTMANDVFSGINDRGGI